MLIVQARLWPWAESSPLLSQAVPAVHRQGNMASPSAPVPGGLDLKTQEAALRAGPDVLIATPGRLIDHLHNTPSFELSQVEVLILDEADRYVSRRGRSLWGSLGWNCGSAAIHYAWPMSRI